MKRLLLSSLLLGSCAPVSHAQSFFTSPATQFVTPGFRGAGAEYSRWDIFYSPSAGINYPDMAAPNGIGSLASEAGATPPFNADPSDPYAFWNPANPGIRQVGNDAAFIIAGSGNIYSPYGATAYELVDATPYTAGTVVMQFQTDGTLMDFGTIRLVANGNTYYPTNHITEYKSSGSTMGGITNRLAVQWNLTGLNITNYTIQFAAGGSSNSLQELLLDSAPTYTEAVPSARTWNSTSGNFSEAAKWSTGLLPSSAGNLLIPTGSSLTVDNSTRTVGALELTAPSAFTINASGSGKLKINTGIIATPAAPAVYNISAPVEMGAYNLSEIGTNADVTLTGVVSGTTGFYKYGGGTLRLTNNNTFTGGVTVDGGVVEISGTNAYTGVTTIYDGTLVIKKNSMTSGGGSLGSTFAVRLGSGGSYGANAALVIDGAFTVANAIALAAGGDAQTLGGRNTGSGALYSGALTLNSAAGNVLLSAETATDRVTFSGTMSGGPAAGTVKKTGQGRVVLSGGAKSYLGSTLVESGTLELASGNNFTSNGDIRVSAGAKLFIHGSLSGTGVLANEGGTIGGSGTTTRSLGVDDGDILAPGEGVGTLTTGSQGWGSGGHFQLDLTDALGADGVGHDYLIASGALSLSSSVGAFTLDLRTLLSGTGGLMINFNPAENYTWRFATATGGISGFSAASFTVNTDGFLNDRSGGFFSVSNSGNDLALKFTAVPEPSSGLLLAIGSLLAVRRRRRA